MGSEPNSRIFLVHSSILFLLPQIVEELESPEPEPELEPEPISEPELKSTRGQHQQLGYVSIDVFLVWHSRSRNNHRTGKCVVELIVWSLRVVAAECLEALACIEETGVEKVGRRAARLERELTEAQHVAVDAELQEGVAPICVGLRRHSQ